MALLYLSPLLAGRIRSLVKSESHEQQNLRTYLAIHLNHGGSWLDGMPLLGPIIRFVQAESDFLIWDSGTWRRAPLPTK